MTENTQPPIPVPPKLNLRKVATSEEATRPAMPKLVPAEPEAEPKPITLKPAGIPPAVPAEPMKPTAKLAETLPLAAMQPPPAPAPTPALKMPTSQQPQTIHIKIPKVPTSQTERTQPIVPQPTGATPTQPPLAAVPAEPAVPEAKKKETSKIPLAAAKPSPTVTSAPSIEAPKTIRIKPKSAIAGTHAPAPAVAPSPAAEPPAEALTDKRKTSRISLEAALIAEDDKDKLLAAKGPKTIRLQRPQATAATVRMPPSPAEAPAMAVAPSTPKATAQTPLVPTAATFEETSQIEPPPMAPEEAGGETRRKTIKVKRPTIRPGITALPTHTIGVGAGAHQQVQQVAKADVMHPFFPIFAIVTLIVMLGTVWMLCAQTFGRNACLTEYSYGAPDFDLPWYGKLPVVQQPH